MKNSIVVSTAWVVVYAIYQISSSTTTYLFLSLLIIALVFDLAAHYIHRDRQLELLAAMERIREMLVLADNKLDVLSEYEKEKQFERKYNK